MKLLNRVAMGAPYSLGARSPGSDCTAVMVTKLGINQVKEALRATREGSCIGLCRVVCFKQLCFPLK